MSSSSHSWEASAGPPVRIHVCPAPKLGPFPTALQHPRLPSLHSTPSFSSLLSSLILFSKSMHSTMPFLPAGTTFKQLEGNPFRSPNCQLLQALLKSACLPQEGGNVCSQISALLAGPLHLLSALHSSACSPHVGRMPALPSNQGRKTAMPNGPAKP